jgi:hypothetical protein
MIIYYEKTLILEGPIPSSTPELLGITNPSRTEIVFNQNPKFEDSRLKNGKKIGDGPTRLMNSVEICSNKTLHKFCDSLYRPYCCSTL